MFDKKTVCKIVATGLLASVAACGGGDAGGVGPYIAEFKTVYVTASQPAPQSVDVRTNNSCPSPTPLDGVSNPDSVSVSVIVTPYTANPLTVDVGQATVTFEALTPGAPVISPVTAASSSYPAVSGTIPIDVQYFPTSRKDTSFNPLICNGSLSYRYNVTVSFPVAENGSSETKAVYARFPMEISDQP